MGQSIKKRTKKRFRKNTENKVKNRKMIEKNQEVINSIKYPSLILNKK